MFENIAWVIGLVIVCDHLFPPVNMSSMLVTWELMKSSLYVLFCLRAALAYSCLESLTKRRWNPLRNTAYWHAGTLMLATRRSERAKIREKVLVVWGKRKSLEWKFGSISREWEWREHNVWKIVSGFSPAGRCEHKHPLCLLINKWMIF